MNLIWDASEEFPSDKGFSWIFDYEAFILEGSMKNCNVIKEPYTLKFLHIWKFYSTYIIFNGFLTKLTNMIIRIQSIIYMNAQTFNSSSLVTLISDIWMSTGTLEMVINDWSKKLFNVQRPKIVRHTFKILHQMLQIF